MTEKRYEYFAVYKGLNPDEERTLGSTRSMRYNGTSENVEDSPGTIGNTSGKIQNE